MPLYDFHCKDNNKTIELFFKMMDVPSEVKQDGKLYERVYSVPNVSVDNSKPKTLGELADQNTKEMIKKGDPRIKEAKPNPWWRPNKKKPIDVKGWSKKKVEKYIKTGER